MSAPQSEIWICSGIPLDNRYEHTIYFDSIAEQQSYFQSKAVRHFSDYTYLRKRWSIKIQADMETARLWDYLFFRNGAGKIWYYFITDIEYINDATVELKLELDVMQSYAFAYTLLPSFVERMHVSNDAIGVNTVDEGLEFGELVSCNESDTHLTDLAIVILSSVLPVCNDDGTIVKNDDGKYDDSIVTYLGSGLGGVYSGLGVFCVKFEEWPKLSKCLQDLHTAGKTEAIVSMWMYPRQLISLTNNSSWESEYFIKHISGINDHPHSLERPATLHGGYVPRNKKLMCYPYNSLYVTNNHGEQAVYKYERFGEPSNIRFKLTGSLSPEGAPYIYPLNYNNDQHAWEEGISLSPYPTCAWNIDAYKLWLAQNQNTQNLSNLTAGLTIAGGAVTTVAGIATANPAVTLGGVGTMIHGGTQIAGLMAQKADKAIAPPQAKGSYSTSTNITAGFQNFTFIQKSITSGWAEILDGYFDMYGYKLNRLMTPSRCTRKGWTYLKTVGCNLIGQIPQDDKQKIASIIDKGITFWNGGGNVLDYSRDNGVNA